MEGCGPRSRPRLGFGCGLFNLEVGLLFFDTTSTYFEADPDIAGGDETDAPAFRALAHSKDHARICRSW